MRDGIDDALSHEEARVLLEKRKEIPPSETLSSRAGPEKKKRMKSKTKATEPTPDNPIIVEDMDEASSEALYRVVQKNLTHPTR